MVNTISTFLKCSKKVKFGDLKFRTNVSLTKKRSIFQFVLFLAATPRLPFFHSATNAMKLIAPIIISISLDLSICGLEKLASRAEPATVVGVYKNVFLQNCIFIIAGEKRVVLVTSKGYPRGQWYL